MSGIGVHDEKFAKTQLKNMEKRMVVGALVLCVKWLSWEKLRRNIHRVIYRNFCFHIPLWCDVSLEQEFWYTDFFFFHFEIFFSSLQKKSSLHLQAAVFWPGVSFCWLISIDWKLNPGEHGWFVILKEFSESPERETLKLWHEVEILQTTFYLLRNSRYRALSYSLDKKKFFFMLLFVLWC